MVFHERCHANTTCVVVTLLFFGEGYDYWVIAEEYPVHFEESMRLNLYLFTKSVGLPLGVYAAMPKRCLSWRIVDLMGIDGSGGEESSDFFLATAV
jgi:hypothetical protein